MCFGKLKELFGSSRSSRIADITAADAQAKAIAALREAVRPPQDNEQARKAAEARMKRLAGMKGVRSAIGAGGRGDMSAPSVGRKMLLGA